MLARSIGDRSRREPPDIANSLAKTGDETDEPGGCAEGCEVRSDDGAGAFIHEIDKHADDAERDHEA